MTIGERIACLRRQQGLTQEQLADALGTTRQAVSKWESGKSTPDIGTAVAMGSLFQVSMDELLLGKSSPEPAAESKVRVRWYAAALTAGVGLACLLPLIAKLYRNFIAATEGRAVVEYCHYLWEWPLFGVVLLDLGLLIAGSAGFVRANREKLKAFWEDFLPW